MRLSLRFILAACSIFVVDACASHLTGRRPGSDMIGSGRDGSRVVREAVSNCGKDPKGGQASPSEQQRCRLAEADAARGKAPQDTAVRAPVKTP